MAVEAEEITLDLEPYRRELTGYCYRMLGSGSEADDAVQEAMVRAWRNAASLKAPGALRAWLYRIATNVCLSMLSGAQRRARPLEAGSLVSADRPILDELPRYTWVEPVADAAVLPEAGDPESVAVARETVRLAFVAALQHLAPRQRAVLILREVLHFSAAETAELLESTVASVNSALQRARATLDGLDIDPVESSAVAAEHEELLDRYVAAFEAYDIDELVALLAHDVVFDMPPHAMWLQGPVDVAKWFVGPGRRVPRLAHRAPARQRPAGDRPVPPRPRRRLGALVDRAHRCGRGRRRDRRDPQLPVPRPVPGVRPADPAGGLMDVAFGRLDPDSGERFQRLRADLGVSAFGMNLIVLAPGQRGRIHSHERQEEVFLVLEGSLSLGLEGEERVLGAGELCARRPAGPPPARQPGRRAGRASGAGR